MAQDTRHRILVASLTLFNENGVLRTALNEIADEIDISPGNLHYHFRKKSQIVEALLDEFRVDARRVLEPPHVDALSLDDFWLFVHLLLELTTTYRFLLRDSESLVSDYPGVGRVMTHFARGLQSVLKSYLAGLSDSATLELAPDDVDGLCRNIAVMALMSERYDELIGERLTPDDASLHAARSILGALKPFATAEAVAELDDLATHYT